MEAERLKPGDLVYDSPIEATAREFTVRAKWYGYCILVHGGDFPSLKILSKARLIRGGWSVREPVAN